jgi:hypothetical protein
MVKLKDEDEIQTETWNPRSPAYQRRDNPDVLEEYVRLHEKAAKEAGPTSRTSERSSSTRVTTASGIGT